MEPKLTLSKTHIGNERSDVIGGDGAGSFGQRENLQRKRGRTFNGSGGRIFSRSGGGFYGVFMYLCVCFFFCLLYKLFSQRCERWGEVEGLRVLSGWVMMDSLAKHIEFLSIKLGTSGSFPVIIASSLNTQIIHSPNPSVPPTPLRRRQPSPTAAVLLSSPRQHQSTQPVTTRSPSPSYGPPASKPAYPSIHPHFHISVLYSTSLKPKQAR